MENNIYQQAVLDAKAVRQSAIANAKATIQEAFEPKIKAMLRKSLTESEEEMDEAEDHEHIVHTNKKHRAGEAGYKMDKRTPEGGIEEDYDEMDENHHEEEMDEAHHEEEEMDESYYEEGSEEELDEKSLDEILDELESMDEDSEEGDEEEVDKAKHHMEEKRGRHHKKEEELDEAKKKEEEAEEEEGEGSEEAGEETKVVDITLGDLVNAIKAAMADNKGEEDHEEAADDSEVSLDEILAELEDEGDEEEMEEVKHKFPKDKEHLKKDKESVAHTHGRALKAAEKEVGYKPAKVEEKKELEEAKRAIVKMRKELNEINLLNAKLLYVNKIFKAKSLSESQKVKVLNAFDRADSIKEVKSVYYAINESIAAPKKQLKESYGFASKAAGVAQKTVITEGDAFVKRMQTLAGL